MMRTPMEITLDKPLLMAQLGRVENSARFLDTINRIDILNDDDPNRLAYEKREIGYELYFSIQLFKRVLDLNDQASEALMIAARSQHICRWMIPREDYPMDRTGYLKWRADLKKFHASKARGIMEEMGYDAGMIGKVSDLNLKKSIKQDPDCQTLEDALCLVFLEKQFAKFSDKTDEEKTVSILRKTWAKMSEQGHEAALAIPLDEKSKRLVERALSGS